MPLDSILVSLIHESTLAHTPAHRRAARIILDLLRSSHGTEGLSEASIAAEMQRDVREHVRHLIEQHGLGRQSVARSG